MMFVRRAAGALLAKPGVWDGAPGDDDLAGAIIVRAGMASSLVSSIGVTVSALRPAPHDRCNL